MVDQLNYGLRNIDFACLFADTASAKFKSPRMGTFVFEASNVPAHIACEIRRVWHASHTPASALVERWHASSFLHWLE
jgi:hypothetical protein